MPFKEQEKVLYKHNPLDKVICQLRFPPILRIDRELPFEFQEKIRDNYPNFQETLEMQQEIVINPQIQQQTIFPSFSGAQQNKNYAFSSEDGIWVINLTRSFIAISTSRYTNWSEFESKFSNPLAALIEIYHPQFFTRIGLRYFNIISRSDYGLADAKWEELIDEKYIGVLSGDYFLNVEHYGSTSEIRLDDSESRVQLNTSLVQKNPTSELCLMIDNDFYYPSKIEAEKVTEKLSYLHTRAYRLLRDIIKDKLHQAMEPEKNGQM